MHLNVTLHAVLLLSVLSCSVCCVLCNVQSTTWELCVVLKCCRVFGERATHHFTVESVQRAAVSHTVNTVCAHKVLEVWHSCAKAISNTLETKIHLKMHSGEDEVKTELL